MMRLAYALGVTYLALCAATLLPERAVEDLAQRIKAPGSGVGFDPKTQSGAAWFKEIRPFCNPVEIDSRIQIQPPPPTTEGKAYEAACHALAGQIDQARDIIDALPRRNQPWAAGVLFRVGHPVADAGDDHSAGPIMRLVLRYQPQNYMALYHAGISECILGQASEARKHLEHFLKLYRVQDGWRTAALRALSENLKPEACGEAPG